MCDWFAILGSKLRPHLEDRSRVVLAEMARTTFTRRYQVVRRDHPALPDPERDPRAVALFVAGLYRLAATPRSRWILSALGGPPRGAGQWWRARQLAATLDVRQRWEEVTVHLGELLIVMTEDMPAHLPRARKILGDICFGAGIRYAELMKRRLGLPEDGQGPELAIEVLRTSEYVFRVNPDHWSKTDGSSDTGWLEGTACPWWHRPGWNGGHCGIFGQFQNGVSHAFGLRYQLAQTIPKHGGSTCRVELSPIPASRLSRPEKRD